MKHTTAAIAVASLSASAAATASGSAASISTSTKSAKSGVGTVCTAADFTGGWKGGVFCGSVASDNDALDELFNGCNHMPTPYNTNPIVSGSGTWEMAVALEAFEGEFAQLVCCIYFI